MACPCGGPHELPRTCGVHFQLEVDVNRRDQPAAIAVVAPDDVHVDQVLQLLQLGEPLPGVVGQVQLLDLAGGVEAEEDGVEDVHVDQGARLVGVAVGLLRLVL